MAYSDLANVAQTWGLVMFMLSFAGVLVYTFRPRNKTLFDDAASIPFKDADDADMPMGDQAGAASKDVNHV